MMPAFIYEGSFWSAIVVGILILVVGNGILKIFTRRSKILWHHKKQSVETNPDRKLYQTHRLLLVNAGMKTASNLRVTLGNEPHQVSVFRFRSMWGRNNIVNLKEKPDSVEKTTAGYVISFAHLEPKERLDVEFWTHGYSEISNVICTENMGLETSSYNEFVDGPEVYRFMLHRLGPPTLILLGGLGSIVATILGAKVSK
jgi:hypothetical protein